MAFRHDARPLQLFWRVRYPVPQAELRTLRQAVKRFGLDYRVGFRPPGCQDVHCVICIEGFATEGQIQALSRLWVEVLRVRWNRGQ
ncbi:MAG: hypothetical protein AAFR76_01565 [Planctomycetota bacterium]